MIELIPKLRGYEPAHKSEMYPEEYISMCASVRAYWAMPNLEMVRCDAETFDGIVKRLGGHWESGLYRLHTAVGPVMIERIAE